MLSPYGQLFDSCKTLHYNWQHETPLASSENHQAMEPAQGLFAQFINPSLYWGFFNQQ
jgi:hypothetical protein